MKFTIYLTLALASLNGASAFAPRQSALARPAVATFMSEESSAETGGKIVAIKEETVEFTAGLIGGVAGLIIGGPVLGAVGAAAANYISKGENEASEILGGCLPVCPRGLQQLANFGGKVRGPAFG